MVDVVIVGGGLAGLACARELNARGVEFLLLEASDSVGGRVRTDEASGFRMDRGFQVLLTAYPEAQRTLDYSRLALRSFLPGAMVWHGGRFHTVKDPFREPATALQALFNNTLTLKDKVLVAKLRMHVAGIPPSHLFRGTQEDTRTWLRQYGFSEQAVTRFFAPFFGGVFLDPALRASSRFFEFLFQCFATAETSIPELGMEQIPLQMAAALPPLRILTQSVAKNIVRSGNRYVVETATGQTVDAKALVLATDADSAHALAGELVGKKQMPSVGWNATTTFYFSAPRAEVEEPILLLNGEGEHAGPVNHACFISQVSPKLAPAGAALFCANVVGQAPATEAERLQLAESVQAHMRRWFGPVADKWQVAGGYFLPRALPLQRFAEWQQGVTRVRAVARTRRKDDAAEIFLCGDYCEQASIQGALVSGRRTAEAVAETLART